jgi:outer membrane lipoprotein SlyB
MSDHHQHDDELKHTFPDSKSAHDAVRALEEAGAEQEEVSVAGEGVEPALTPGAVAVRDERMVRNVARNVVIGGIVGVVIGALGGLVLALVLGLSAGWTLGAMAAGAFAVGSGTVVMWPVAHAAQTDASETLKESGDDGGPVDVSVHTDEQRVLERARTVLGDGDDQQPQ